MLIHRVRFNVPCMGLVALVCALSGSAAHAQCVGYALTQSSGATIDPGVADIGNHADDATTAIALPFAFAIFGVPYTTLNVSSNGTAQFTTNNVAFGNGCLPAAGMGVMIAPHWDDLRTDGVGDGIFTFLTGVSPARVFNIEWRTHYYGSPGTANFEVRLFEDGSHLEVVFGRIDEGGSSATVGIQHTASPPVQVSCNTGGIVQNGTRLTFACYNGPTGTAAAFPNPVYACGTQGTTLLTATVTPGSSPPSTGMMVTADLTSIGGPTGQAFYNDGTHGDASAGDGIWSFRLTVPPIIPAGDKSIPYTLADAQGRSTTVVLGVTVNPCASTGPDVIVRGLTDVNYYGALGSISAYSIGTDACNIGDFPAMWIQGGPQHPVIAQNMYRLKNGRFEQIGQSFLKYGFQSLNSPGCGTCVQPPLGGAQLGVGCSDVYGAGYNGGQGNLGPRSTCNGTTGVYVSPPPPPPGNVIGQRLQVFTSDIDPALNAGAQYFGEAHYVTADDAQWTLAGAPATNGLNNATYQRLLFANTTSAPTLSGPVHQMSPAIQAWRDVDPAVSIAVADYVDTSLPGPGIVCRFWIAGRATDNGNGTWHYEYAVHNLNADRSGGSFSVPIPLGVGVANVGFHGVFAHSGEPYPNTATNPDNWAGSVVSGTLMWSAPEPFVAPNGNNANALRWGTMYNFRFDASTPPTAAGGRAVSIGLFKPGTPTAISAALIGPSSACAAVDFDGVGGITVEDIFAYLGAFFAGDPRADFNHFGGISVQDIFDFLGAWFSGC